MDPRRSYPEEPEPQWFGHERQEWDPRRIPEQRLAPEQRRGDGPPGPPVGPRSGEPLPPEPAVARHHTETIDRSALRRSVSDGIYRARRPAVALLVGASAGTAAVVILAALVRSSLPVNGVISGVLVLLGLPLGALGMYGLVTGAAKVPDAPPAHAWLRPPLAYLAVALVLFLAAGLAAA